MEVRVLAKSSCWAPRYKTATLTKDGGREKRTEDGRHEKGRVGDAKGGRLANRIRAISVTGKIRVTNHLIVFWECKEQLALLHYTGTILPLKGLLLKVFDPF